MRILVILLSAVLFNGCDNPDERYKTGYKDGYAVGYNTTCKIRTTIVEGAFDNKDYARGYKLGRIKGSEDCRKRNK